MTVPIHPLQGREVAIATMHGKEAVLVPPLRRFDIVAVRPAALDTDTFGTFTGEVPRQGTPLEAARSKARAAMRLAGTRAAVASEGSFGPHPHSHLVTLAVEIVLLLDDEHGLEVVAEDVGTDTNFAGLDLTTATEAHAFAARIGFPSHHLVLTIENEPAATVRGIAEPDQLLRETARLLRSHGVVRLQTDMRADRNPTRMRAIARAADRLAERAAARCPGCAWPGFGLVRVERGLPCAGCGEPSQLVRTLVHGCARCPEHRELPRTDGRTECDPGACECCNP